MFKIILNSLSAHVVVILFRFISSIILARELGSVGRGDLAIIMTGLQFIQPINLLLNGGNDIKLNEDGKNEFQLVLQGFLWPSFLTLILFSSLNFNIFQVSSLVFTSEYNSLGFYILFSLFFFFSSIESNFRILNLAKQKYSLINKVQMITIVLYFLILILLISMCNLGVYGALMAFVMHQILMGTVYLVVVLINVNKDYFTNLGLLRNSILYGAKSILVTLPTLLLLNVDIWILKDLTTSSEVGIYQISVGLCTLILAFVSLIRRLFRARTFIDQKIEGIVFNTSKIIFLLAILYAVVLWMFGDYIFTFLYGDEYLDSYYSARILTIGVMFYAVVTPMIGYIISKQKIPLGLLISTIVAFASNVILNLYFIPIMGVEGASLSSLISYMLLAVYVFYMWNKATGINPYSIFNFDYRFLKTLLVKRK